MPGRGRRPPVSRRPGARGVPGGPRRGTLSAVKIYADRFPVALRQFLTDLLVVVWVYAAIRFAMWLYDLVEKLAVPGRKLEGAGGGLADNLAEAGGKTVVNAIIPFRGLVRELTGAAPADRRLNAALDAGYARRGFLRGVHAKQGCRTTF